VNVFIFFRPNQDHSLEALKQMAACEKELEGKPVHWVAIVADAAPEPDVRETVRQSGIRMPVLVDRGDALYGLLGVKLHPSIGIADPEHRLAAYEPFKMINYCETVRARIRYLLHEIDAAQLESALHPPQASIASGNEATARRYVMLGRMQLKSRQYDKALESARKSLEADTWNEAGLVLMGKALGGLGRCDEARKAFGQALERDPKNPAALEGIESCQGK
jgi:tetratricopeptide (TPR) repeat protein